MKIINELLIYPPEPEAFSCYMFTSNHIIKKDGELVMGAGNALAFKKAYPLSPAMLAKCITSRPSDNIHFMFYDSGLIGSFKTKEHWANPSTLDIIKESVYELSVLAEPSNHTYHLPFPGIGKGGLSREEVEPLLQELPDNVLIYIKE